MFIADIEVIIMTVVVDCKLLWYKRSKILLMAHNQE